MGKIFKLPIRINSANGQMQTYVKTKQLPKDILDSIREQPSATRKLLMEFRGLE